MAFVAPLLPLLGTIGAGVSAASAVYSGLYQGQVAQNNATIATQNATLARQTGQQQGAVSSEKGAAKIAEIKGAYAANNVDVNSGSAADVEAGQRGTNALDTATVLHNADLSAYGYTTQASNDEAEATQDRIQGVLKGAGSLLGNSSGINTGKWAGVTGAPDDSGWGG